MHDLVQAYEVLHSVLVPRGLYAEVGMTLLSICGARLNSGMWW